MMRIAFLLLLLLNSTVTRAEQADVLISGHYPPMMIEGNAQLVGFSNDVVLEAARRLKRDITIQFLPFNRALRAVQERENAIQGSLFRNAKREANFRWLIKTHSEYLSINTKDVEISQLNAAKQLPTIVVERGSGLDDFLTSQSFDNLLRTNSPQQSARLLFANRAQAWAMTKSQAQWVWKSEGFDGDLKSGAPFEIRDVYVVTGLKFPRDVAELFRAEIAKMLADGTFDRMRQSYGVGIAR